MKRVLLACEESQAVCIEFRKLGIEAFSCDIMDCSGGHPEWHIKGDVVDQLTKGWGLMIAFPPCTFLTVTGARWLYNKDGSKNIERWKNRELGLDFFRKIMDAPIDRIAIENPVGAVSTGIKKPTQIIQPYYFGDESQKTTCLWLKNLPPLYHNRKPNLFDSEVTHVGKGEMFEWVDKKTGKLKRQPKWFMDALKLPAEERGHIRSKTFPGIAKEMAKQWSKVL